MMKIDDFQSAIDKTEEFFKCTEILWDIFDSCHKNIGINHLINQFSKIEKFLDENLVSNRDWMSDLQKLLNAPKKLEPKTALELQHDVITYLIQIKKLVNSIFEAIKDNEKHGNEFFKKIEKKSDLINEILEATQIIYGISIINTIIVIHESTGIAIYSETLGSIEFEPILILNFFPVIPFAPENMKKRFSVHYGDNYLEGELGELSLTALFLVGKPHVFLLECLSKFVKEFESKFKKELSEFNGVLSPFQKTKDLFYEIFKFK